MEYILEILEAKANTVLNKNIDFITLLYGNIWTGNIQTYLK